MLKEMMTTEEALNWVKKWRQKHWSKVLGVKDKALITLAAEVEKNRLPAHYTTDRLPTCSECKCSGGHLSTCSFNSEGTGE